MFEGPHAMNVGRVSPGALLLVGATVVGSGRVNVSFWDGEDIEMLVLSVIYYVKTWRLSVSSVSF